MLLECDRECRRRRKQSFLEELQDKFSGELLTRRRRRLGAEFGVTTERVMCLLFRRGIWHFQVLHAPFGESAAAVPSQLQLGLHPPHHDRVELSTVWRNGSGEALIVEKLQQRREALFVAIVRCRREKELVFKIGSQRANRHCP